ncbi:MAG: site-specific DNA-methyltransferase [Planctomycetaceae bacterium]|nr:site-specific DNA-methyltransferase [Planctomycetaceae bacterium]
MEKLDASTPDLTRQNIERLLELFPGCRTEGSREDAPSVDFDLLRQALSDYLVEGPAERYRLDWPGKRQALLTANTPIDKTLRPCREESVDFDTTRNLFIEGDNLDALKLLQETYLGKVKMIYIDPPYNTGNDFVYKDNFSQSRGEYEEESGQRDETAGRLVANPESNGRFHSDWLSMMYPRLKLAKNLLSDNGVIFVSIDDNECHALKRVCDDIFGEAQFLANIVWRRTVSGAVSGKGFSTSHDHVLCYSKSEAADILKLPPSDTSGYSNPDNDPRGPYKKQKLERTLEGARPTMTFEIQTPVGPLTKTWAVGKEKFEQLVSENRIVFSDSGLPYYKQFLSEFGGNLPETIWGKDQGNNQEGSRQLRDLFGEKNVFTNPKPTRLIRHMISLVCNEPADLVMDFYLGSGSTAQAVLEHNAETESNLSFVGVQIDEVLDDESVAANLGYRRISEVSRERIRLAGQAVLNQYPELKGKLDTGFRAFRIDYGNFVDTSVTPKEATQEALLGMVSHIKNDRSEEDLLFGALLRWGVDITLPIEQRELAGRTVWLVDGPEDGSGNGAALIACFAKPGSSGPNGKSAGIDTELADAMAALAPLRVLFRDDGFADDATKENVHSRFKQLAPDTRCPGALSA